MVSRVGRKHNVLNSGQRFAVAEWLRKQSRQQYGGARNAKEIAERFSKENEFLISPRHVAAISKAANIIIPKYMRKPKTIVRTNAGVLKGYVYCQCGDKFTVTVKPFYGRRTNRAKNEKAVEVTS